MLINSAPWTWQMCKFKVHWYWYHIDFVLTCFWFSCWIQIIWCSRLCNRVSWISTANKSCQISADRPLVLDRCATLRRPPHGNPSWGKKEVSRSLWLSRVIHLYVGIMQEVGGPVSTESPLRPACISGSPSSPSSLSSSVMYSSESSSLSEMWTVTWRRR